MEKMLEKLSLGLIFRQLFCGLTFITAFYYSGHPSMNPFRLFEQYKDHILPLTAAAFVIGSVIYAMHRAITNPAFELLRRLIATNLRKKHWCSLFTSEKLVQDTVLRWRLDCRLKKPTQNFHDWGDYVQLLYTTGISIWTGSLTWRVVRSSCGNSDFNCTIFVGGLFILLIGFLNDIRKYLYENELYNYDRKREHPSQPDSEDLKVMDWGSTSEK